MDRGACVPRWVARRRRARARCPALRLRCARRARVGIRGRRTQGRATVLSDLRLTLAEQRLRGGTAELDGVEAAEVAVASVAGRRSARRVFRAVPPADRARVPRAACRALLGRGRRSHLGARHARHAPAGTRVHVADRPLLRRNEAASDGRRSVLLANHYLDVVRGLPTLRAFNRSHAQTASIADVSEQYRRTTMSTLRVGFFSGSVLELAATLGVALVAVTVGVRLDDGRLGLQAGSDGAAARAGAVPPAAPARRAIPHERGRPRRRRADPRPDRRGRRAGASSRPAQPCGGCDRASSRFLRLSVAAGVGARRRST